MSSDFNSLPPYSYGGENDQGRWLWQSAEYRSPRSRRPAPLWRERYEQLLAEAEQNRLARRLPQGEKWQCQACQRLGHWLAALGRSLEKYGEQAALGPAAGSAGR